MPLTRLAYFLIISLLLCLFTWGVMSTGIAGMRLWNAGPTSEGFELKVDKGASFYRISSEIAEGSHLPSNRPLSFYAKVAGVDRRMKQGRYRMGSDWSPSQMLEQLTIGSNDPLRVTLTPGSTLIQCAEKVASAGWVTSATAFIEAASGEQAAALSGRSTLEGLIAPETYFFDGTDEASDVVAQMYDQWRSEALVLAGTIELNARMRNGLTLYDTITLASLVEKEAASIIEMATVASVFHNRIRKKWPMGSVATLRYALHDWELPENRIPVNLKSPFNTNRKPGLPPHPICFPSRDALRAALQPADTPYFFFVADGEGRTVFNVTHEEHIRSARNYREKMRELQE